MKFECFYRKKGKDYLFLIKTQRKDAPQSNASLFITLFQVLILAGQYLVKLM